MLVTEKPRSSSVRLEQLKIACPAGQHDEWIRLWQSQKTHHQVQRNTGHHLKKLLQRCENAASYT